MTGPDLLVLHALRCIGFVSLSRVAATTGLGASDAESELIELARAGLVTRVPGEFGGWGLTDAGKAADAERIGAELEVAGARPTVAAEYERFLGLNPKLLDICTTWQMLSVAGVAIMNDHTDPRYDARVLNRLADVDRRAEIVIAELAAALPRFGRYRVRLAEALSHATAGAVDYVTESVASYHAVWFQLHEDLLATLGIPR